jgi:hypothetical protein
VLDAGLCRLAEGRGEHILSVIYNIIPICPPCSVVLFTAQIGRLSCWTMEASDVRVYESDPRVLNPSQRVFTAGLHVPACLHPFLSSLPCCHERQSIDKVNGLADACIADQLIAQQKRLSPLLHSNRTSHSGSSLYL